MDPSDKSLSRDKFISNCSGSSLTSSSWFSKSSVRSLSSGTEAPKESHKPACQAAMEAEGWQVGDTIYCGQVSTVKRARLGTLAGAVKFAQEAVDSQQLKRQHAMLCKLEDKHIMKVEDFFQVEQSSCSALVMEFVEGLKLSHILSWEGPMSLDARWSILEQVLAALAYLHERKIAHQRLHPKKMLVRCSRSVATLKLIDFGRAAYCDDVAELPFPVSSASLESKIMPPGALDAGKYPDVCNDMFAAGLVAAGLVSGRSLLTKQVYPDSLLVLPDTTSSAQLTVSASDYLSKFLSLNPCERPTAATACRNLLQTDMWLEPRRRGTSIMVSL